MKYQKKFILIFCLFWVVGLVGGYYLGVGSAILPTESIEYNYYFSEKGENSSVEPIKKECSNEDEIENEEGGMFIKVIKSFPIFSIPQKVIQNFFSPRACNEVEKELVVTKKLA